MSNATVCELRVEADSNLALLGLVDELEARIEVGDLGGIIEAAAAIRCLADHPASHADGPPPQVRVNPKHGEPFGVPADARVRFLLGDESEGWIEASLWHHGGQRSVALCGSAELVLRAASGNIVRATLVTY